MENIWSVVISTVKKILAVRSIDILRSTSNLSVREHRLRALEELIEEGMRSITPAMCINFVAKIQSKVVDAINMVDMKF